jgi:hypothetical protein
MNFCKKRGVPSIAVLAGFPTVTGVGDVPAVSAAAVDPNISN